MNSKPPTTRQNDRFTSNITQHCLWDHPHHRNILLITPPDMTHPAMTLCLSLSPTPSLCINQLVPRGYFHTIYLPLNNHQSVALPLAPFMPPGPPTHTRTVNQTTRYQCSMPTKSTTSDILNIRSSKMTGRPTRATSSTQITHPKCLEHWYHSQFTSAVTWPNHKQTRTSPGFTPLPLH